MKIKNFTLLTFLFVTFGFSAHADDACSKCVDTDVTRADCFNRINKKWTLLYKKEEKVKADAYLKTWNTKNLGESDEMSTYIGKYKTCDKLPHGRLAIFYGYAPAPSGKDNDQNNRNTNTTTESGRSQPAI